MSLAFKIFLLALSLLPLHSGATEPIGLLTIADGEGYLIRKTQKLPLKVGTKVFAQDLLQTDPKSTLVRVELNRGGIFDFGPSSLGILQPGLGSTPGKAASVYLLKGWLKVSAATKLAPAASVALAERLEVLEDAGSAVLWVAADGVSLFAESGALSLAERRGGKAASPTALGAGALYSAAQGDKGVSNSRVPASFTQSVPKGFQESIPALQAKVMARPEPVSKPLGELGYTEALPWLSAEPMVRNLLLALWKNQLPSDLRQGLLAHIGAHPEWRSTLLPDKNAVHKSPAPGLGTN